MIIIDGSKGEGGGQILRSSLALSLITGQPFRMVNVRARRTKPGLQPQHLMSVQAAAEIGKAKVTGAELKSQQLTFEPGEVRPGEYHFRINTAGSTGLVLHTVYLPLALTGQDCQVIIEGGTHVSTSPCFDFLNTTWTAYMRHLGIHIELSMPRAGFYPRGGGRIEAKIRGVKREQLKPLHLERLTFENASEVEVYGFSAVAGLPENIADRQAKQARERLDEAGYASDINIESWPGGPGTVIGLIVPTQPVPTFFFSIGERGKRAEAVADDAVRQTLAYLARPPAIDEHSGDQLVLPLALSPEKSHYAVQCLTEHVCTNVGVMNQFLPRPIRCLGKVGEPGSVEFE